MKDKSFIFGFVPFGSSDPKSGKTGHCTPPRERNGYITKKYISFFRIRFQTGVQYRAAAAAGIATQVAFGGIFILMYAAFFKDNADKFPMTFSQLTSYLWLQQAFLALFVAWFFENEIFDAITSGNIAYELCRPMDLYSMWFTRSVANRLSRAALRCMPILIFASLIPAPYKLSLPSNLFSGMLFLISAFLGFLVVVAFCMLIYIATFFTISPLGLRMFTVSAMEIFSGSVIPLPFLPDGVRKVFELLPFASMQNTPFLIYGGSMAGLHALRGILLQGIWLVILWISGRLLMRRALGRVVVQGG